MPTPQQTTGPAQPADKFRPIFEAAVSKYKEITKKSLDTHPFAKKLDGCDSPEAVSKIFRTQAEVFSESCEGDKKVMTVLDPIIHILLSFSDAIAEGIGLVRLFIRSA